MELKPCQSNAPKEHTEDPPTWLHFRLVPLVPLARPAHNRDFQLLTDSVMLVTIALAVLGLQGLMDPILLKA